MSQTLSALADVNLGAASLVSGVSGGTVSSLSTGDPSSFFNGFAQGALTFGLGQKLKGAHGITKAAAHGVVGGAFAKINGGEFETGFLAAGFSKFAGSYLSNRGVDFDNPWIGGSVSAITGGIAAELGGGKFEDGAKTATFGYLFNYLSEYYFENHRTPKKGFVLLSARTTRCTIFCFNKKIGEFGTTSDSIDIVVGQDQVGSGRGNATAGFAGRVDLRLIIKEGRYTFEKDISVGSNLLGKGRRRVYLGDYGRHKWVKVIQLERELSGGGQLRIEENPIRTKER